MRIVYLGTPDFAVLPLEKIISSGREVVGVVTNKDKPVGRKRVLTAPPVKVVAQSHGIPVFQYDKIRVEGVQDLINLAPDIMITCAFGQILSQEILDIPKLGVINIHASLLPKYRGASPIHYAILNGEKVTGITIMKTDIGIDTGDILLEKPLEIKCDETCGQLFERLSDLGADSIIEALELIENGKASFIKQNDEQASFSKIITKELAKIDWNNDAVNIYNQIRAFNPSPVAYCLLEGQPFKIYQAKVVNSSGKPGEILVADKNLVVACGNNALSLEVVQKSGGKQMAIKDFLLGNRFIVGEELK
ncbi:MAG: methionyl-tRNA formyltransferase [Clostridia bacterium]|nr:methionyl-tRNA formyltransferase [Clostridia bacterium]